MLIPDPVAPGEPDLLGPKGLVTFILLLLRAIAWTSLENSSDLEVKSVTFLQGLPEERFPPTLSKLVT